MAEFKAESQIHKLLVTALVGYFVQNGWKILAAACDGYPEPWAEGRHEPDCIARKDGILGFGEAKTGGGDLNTQHSREQYLDFSRMVMKDTGKPCPFFACVPRAHYEELEKIFVDLGISRKPNVQILTY